jgi:hypothetical protein
MRLADRIKRSMRGLHFPKDALRFYVLEMFCEGWMRGYRACLRDQKRKKQ